MLYFSDDVLCCIFSFLDVKDFLNLQSSRKKWREVVHSQSGHLLWYNLYNGLIKAQYTSSIDQMPVSARIINWKDKVNDVIPLIRKQSPFLINDLENASEQYRLTCRYYAYTFSFYY